MYSPSVLDITEEDLLSKVKTGIANITALSLQTHYPTEVCPRCFLISTVSCEGCPCFWLCARGGISFRCSAGGPFDLPDALTGGRLVLNLALSLSADGCGL